jgi:hypothetical protein
LRYEWKDGYLGGERLELVGISEMHRLEEDRRDGLSEAEADPGKSGEGAATRDFGHDEAKDLVGHVEERQRCSSNGGAAGHRSRKQFGPFRFELQADENKRASTDTG